LLSGAIGFVAGLSTAVDGAAVVVVPEVVAGVVFTGVESLPGAGGDSGAGVASLAGVPGAVVESIGVVTAGGGVVIADGGVVVSAVRSFGGGASLHAATAKAQQIASVSGCRVGMTNLQN